MTASASAFATKLQISVALVDVPDDEPGDEVAAADDDGADDDVPPLAAALEVAAALELAFADDDGDVEVNAEELALGRADAVAELVPRAAGDPLEPPVLVVG
jgi:hypothetical protein